MGTTLENGVYLPSEGERNCYAGLKTNWEILDQKVADVTALQQAVAGALHREIVESLPTTDIDPNTIYMVLSGTSATENVYNEYMYVNNAWELIGTSATDLTNYYTKGEIDGKLLLKANDSDVVHKSGNETISGVKSFINYFLGKDLSGQTVDLNDCVDAYSGAMHYYYAVSNYTNISNKPENKPFILESKTVRYVSSADYTYYQKIYTADYNATPSIYTRYYRSGSASWSNWIKDTDKFVTTDTNQTISGNKTFLDIPISFKSSTAELGVTGGNAKVIFTDKNLLNLAGITFGNYESSKLSYCRFHIYDKDSNNQEVENFIEFSYVNNNQVAYLRPNKSNFATLGTVNNRWSKVYANEYYYGSNNVEFSTKFVTTDTDQTINGVKSFSDNISTKKIISNVAQLQINAKSSADSVAIIAGADASEGGGFWCYGKNSGNGSDCRMQIYNTSKSRYESIDLVGSQFLPNPSGELDCGGTSNKWKTFNGLNPGCLSLPDFSNAIDISSYITVTGGSIISNSYTPPTDGYISVNLGRSSGAIGLVLSNGKIEVCVRENTFPDNHRECGGFIPVQKNDTVVIISCLADSTIWAYFIPCLGNV
jgi:hypothetical protein